MAHFIHFLFTYITNAEILVFRHVKEHLDVPIDVNKMSEDELTFHYFKMLDVDKDAHLDGQELLSSIIHSTGFTKYL